MGGACQKRLAKKRSPLSRTMQTVRSGLYGKVSDVVGGFGHLTEIGIQTERYVTGSMGVS